MICLDRSRFEDRLIALATPTRLSGAHGSVTHISLSITVSTFTQSKVKVWRPHEIPHFTLSPYPCSGCIVNLDGPCQGLQQFHHPRYLRVYHPRNTLPPGR